MERPEGIDKIVLSFRTIIALMRIVQIPLEILRRWCHNSFRRVSS